MSRLIDADKLKEELNELRKSPWFNENVHGIIEQASYKAKNEALNIVEKLVIDNAPTVERSHGEWTTVKGIEGTYYCSECDGDIDWKSRYCPWCGAKMEVDYE